MKPSLWFMLALATLRTSAAEVTPLKADERVVFYPTLAQRVPGRDLWRAEVRGCVFEPASARVSVAMLREALELKTGELTPAESVIFRDRARLFLVDHERGKRIYVRLGTNEFFVGRSGADGNFARVIEFRDDGTRAAGRDARISFTAVLPPGDPRRFSGVIIPVVAEGVSVISDLDDTIKITEVRDRMATVRNTFFREFQPVPGMAEFYMQLARSNQATFHYVSASPWQLYEPLQEFVRANEFPAGTFHLKPFRWKSRTFFSLFADPVKFKLSVIVPILKQFPARKFLLVGDSGEQDPEIYGELARLYPEQIERVYIRDVTGEGAMAVRYELAFRSVQRKRWLIFQHPDEIIYDAD